ncbi:hypothetical protein EDB87DRAFT_622732 [Lactarius vividus]|nr:hypothetical protein EDB87DRAFT_622732 [Lactarius vividus]
MNDRRLDHTNIITISVIVERGRMLDTDRFIRRILDSFGVAFTTFSRLRQSAAARAIPVLALYHKNINNPLFLFSGRACGMSLAGRCSPRLCCSTQESKNDCTSGQLLISARYPHYCCSKYPYCLSSYTCAYISYRRILTPTRPTADDPTSDIPSQTFGSTCAAQHRLPRLYRRVGVTLYSAYRSPACACMAMVKVEREVGVTPTQSGSSSWILHRYM